MSVVEGYKRKLYARLVVAMKRSEALGLLGLSGYPSEDDIKKAYRAKALENHPDRGGNPDLMVKINVAKDVLTGVQRAEPEFQGGYTSRPNPPPPTRG